MCVLFYFVTQSFIILHKSSLLLHNHHALKLVSEKEWPASPCTAVVIAGEQLRKMQAAWGRVAPPARATWEGLRRAAGNAMPRSVPGTTVGSHGRLWFDLTQDAFWAEEAAFIPAIAPPPVGYHQPTDQ